MLIDVLVTGDDKKSYFIKEEIETPIHQALGSYSVPFSSNSVQFRSFAAGLVFPMHVAPRRQYIVYLEGSVRVDASGGESKTFSAGNILCAKDVEGEGHISTTLEAGRAIIISLD